MIPKINRTTRDINHQLSQNGAVIQMFNNLKNWIYQFESKTSTSTTYSPKGK
jgi:hypothetical protein